MNIAVLIAGLSLGAISSFHCVGMCGPIAFALPVQELSKTKRQLAVLAYHSGRVLTYATLGAIFGLLGRQVYIAGFQRWFSIVLGILVLLLLIQYIHSKQGIQPSVFNHLQRKVQQWMGYLLKNRKPASFLLLGMANGLLPCGMVYLAIAGALSTNNLADGIIFMTSFGLGTFPAMLTLSLFGYMASISVRNNIKKLTPFIIAAMGILLILRGLNMGIPYISPVLESARGAAIDCH
ncbi:sulfite exporter TauE/SafE family protein [Flavihumibacter fluvii]|uniref:sulfite exporter TauE/SafE family protein n=1 Tax=Flavihumibacter fluvii TaxID=2838157 RepID=UPI001BDF6510|nr:sulfite exporter TauE/SafE family protein [Flavihumibacter fluvii]ULQ50831.1 sulfite exporter TauE/SafE family protein [Flavihumibacter fluvii]